ncbi:inositol monophosphatase family protein [Pontiella agarivorans]|uniref:Inositol-1-monophosphatase n=1 Tax=Pontiella agarivorans TaxID=3038953 RepID=A0ABU5MXB7_9BACT|nr:inositol monophosphatase family protein [Pontiella agarivorans]MDZ8118850.1 inositol monophosphatase family protein [Pontiella agarivorans]
MKNPSLSDLLDVAVAAAKAAGSHAFNNKARRTETNEVFTHDVKLVLDVESQKQAEAVISKVFPEHGILGEEDATPNQLSDYEWIIDPIDGTMNFSHGLEYWCSSVAVRHKGKIVAGCVFAPEFDACYTAHRDDSARLNGEPIQVRQTSSLKKALILTGLSKEIEVDPELYFGRFQKLTLRTKKLRLTGAAALDLCRVADGSADGFFEGSIFLWDYAAATLIVEQAGGLTRIFNDTHPAGSATVVASNRHIFDDLKSIYTQPC